MLIDAAETLIFLREFRLLLIENNQKLDDAVVNSCILIIEDAIETFHSKQTI